MARQANDTLFLEELLRSSSGATTNSSTTTTTTTTITGQPSSTARAIIKAWADLRDFLQQQSFQPNHFQALKVLLHYQTSFHVADPQAKLILSILSSQNIALPLESYPLFLRLLYIWIRKSFRPSLELVDSAVEVLSKLLHNNFRTTKSAELFAETVILLGALAFVPSITENSKTVCLEFLCKLLDEDDKLVSSAYEFMPDVLAGIGYALCSCSSVKAYYVRILDVLFGIWGKEDGLHSNVSHGLMVLHLIDWIMLGYIKTRSHENLQIFAHKTLETPKSNYIPFVLVMAAAGVLRALNRSIPDVYDLQIVSRLRISAENRIESVAQDLIVNARSFSNVERDYNTSCLLKCISLALARCGPVSARSPVLVALASALVMEIFPLRYIYSRILRLMHGSPKMVIFDVKEHLNGVPFKEAGVISGILCNQYALIDEENKMIVENMIWHFCQELYLGHRQVALILRGKEDELLLDIEKVAESAFLMVVFFASAVTKQKLNKNFSIESQMETSVSILVSFSCVEYFRRMRLPEYMDTIRGVVVNIQENETACDSFLKSMPSYVDLTNPQDFLQKNIEYKWFEDEVQTARILFNLRVIPTCIEHLPSVAFSKTVAPVMFLYMGHPNGKVARSSHSMFSAFISSGKDSNENERASLKEQLAFFYVQRSLMGYPGITPFEGMASGVAVLVRNLPAGSPATFYCIHSLVDKANMLCTNIFTQEADMWKSWQGASEPYKKMLELLLRLIYLVDVQVLPNLMKQLAQLIIQLPKDGQNAVLNELYAQVAESDDVTRKPTLVSWLQSLCYLCSQETSGVAAFRFNESRESSFPLPDPSNRDRIDARL